MTKSTGAPNAAIGVGDLLAGRWRVDDFVAQGVEGTVWRAHDVADDRPVALKLVHGHLIGDEQAERRFEREVAALRRVAHENVMHLIDVIDVRGQPGLISEFVAGPSLGDALTVHGTLDDAAVAAVGVAVAEGLGAIHQAGLVHRDIKPRNLLITRDGVVKIVDFGIAKRFELDSDTEDGVIRGTAAYLAPEQVEGESLDGRADVYSLGLVLWEMVAGRPAFQRDTQLATALARIIDEVPPLVEVAPDTSEQLSGIIAQATAHDRDRRFDHAGALREALDRMRLGDPRDVLRALAAS